MEKQTTQSKALRFALKTKMSKEFQVREALPVKSFLFPPFSLFSLQSLPDVVRSVCVCCIVSHWLRLETFA